MAPVVAQANRSRSSSLAIQAAKMSPLGSAASSAATRRVRWVSVRRSAPRSSRRRLSHSGSALRPRRARLSQVVRRHRQVVDLVWWLRGLVVVAIAARYKGYRYPIEVIGHAVWLYHRFGVS